jgi:Tripartite tricarboxylate transporter TctB family
MKIANQKDFATGAFYMAFGLLTAAGASRYEIGSAQAMGPGYFPLLAGIILAALGLTVLASSFSGGAEKTLLEAWNLRKIFVILVSLVLFAIALEPLGLVVALPLLVGLSSLAHPEFSWRGTLLLIAFLLPFVWAIFVYFLGLSIPFLPFFVR